MAEARPSKQPMLDAIWPPDSGRASSIGLRFDRENAEVRGVLLSFEDSPLESPPQIQLTESEPIPHELLCLYDTVENNESDAETRESLSNDLTIIATRIIERLLSGSVASVALTKPSKAGSVDDILAIGIHGSGVWLRNQRTIRGYQELVDASRVAEQFGKTVIDNFPSRDIAQGGNGGPIECHGLGIMLADRSSTIGCRWRGLVDIAEQSTRFFLIGPPDVHRKALVTMANEICTGSRFWSELTASHSENSTDIRKERFATSGRVIPPLLETWDATPCQTDGWSPKGVSPLPLVYALRDSVHGDRDLEDQLVTATHFLVGQIERHVKHMVPASTPVGELFVMGDGGRNPLLLQSLREAIPAIGIRHLSELGQDRTIYAAAVAALTLLHIWQVPVPSTSNLGVPRLLGRLTPGNPNNWRRVLHSMTSNAPWVLPLREAI